MIRPPLRSPRSGADLLRLIVRNMDDAPESFNDQFSAAELFNIYAAHIACGWDYPPHEWTRRQLDEARLKNKPPRWDSDERPVYS